jgi:hypothetical protein
MSYGRKDGLRIQKQSSSRSIGKNRSTQLAIKYCAGAEDTMKVLKTKFGMTGEKVDAFGIRFFGDIDNAAKHLGRIGEMFSDPDMSPMIKHQRITLWFTFEKIRPYERGSNLLRELVARLRGDGYTIVVSSIDDLADTTLPEYKGTPESAFPSTERMHGYNATGGFSVTAEKEKTEAKFSLKEIETIRALAIKFAHAVYGRSLPRII